MGSGVLAGKLVLTTLLLRARSFRASLGRMYGWSLLTAAPAPVIGVGVFVGMQMGDTTADIILVLASVCYVLVVSQSLLLSRIGSSDFKRRWKALRTLDALVQTRVHVELERGSPMATVAPGLIPLHHNANVVSYMNSRTVIKRFGSRFLSQFQILVGVLLVEFLLFSLLLGVSLLTHSSLVTPSLAVFAYYPIVPTMFFVLKMMHRGGRINRQGLKSAAMLREYQMHVREQLARQTVAEVGAGVAMVERHCATNGCKMSAMQMGLKVIPAEATIGELQAGDKMLSLAILRVTTDEQSSPLTFLGLKLGPTLTRSAGTLAASGLVAAVKHFLPLITENVEL